MFVLALVGLAGMAVGDASGAHAGPTVQDAQSQLDGVVAQIQQAAAERDALRTQMADLLGRIDQNRRALERTQADVDATRGEIADLRRQVDSQQEALDQRAADAYVMGPTQGLEVALGATSMSDFQVILEYLNASSRRDQQLIDGLTQQRAELQARQDDLAGLLSHLEGTRTALSAQASDLGDRLSRQTAAVAALEAERAQAEALVQTLQDRAARAAARWEIQQAGGQSDPGPSPKPKPGPPPPPDPGPEAVKALITQYFSPLGDDNVTKAMCVADRESDFNPLAENPISGAAGVFQFLPSTWALFAPAAGWGGHSAFEAEANVAVAAWTVGNYGWSSWSSDSGSCGL
jgi:peptidoglycan hydrolase CwlO-like protein